jgi:hypothetical protein
LARPVTESTAPALSHCRIWRSFEYAILHAQGSKACTILALNSALLALLFWCLFSDADTVGAVTAKFGMETWGMLSLMCVTLTASIVGIIAGLWSRAESKDFDVGFTCGATTLVPFLGAIVSYVLRSAPF